VWLQGLDARDFRNLAHVALRLPPDGMVIVGENGQGKTNLLEAIAYLHLLRSVRGARDTDVVRFGADGFSVRGHLAAGAGPSRGARSQHSTVVLGFERATRRKRLTIDGGVPDRLSDGLGAVPSVTFSPADVDLVRGGPAGRRRYVDVVLATTSRRYLAALQQYRGALVRRNAALRSLVRRAPRGSADGGDAPASPLASASTTAPANTPASASAATPARALDAALGAWEPMLADAGAVLWAERAEWACRKAPELARTCAAIGERGSVEMRYAPHLPAGPSAHAIRAGESSIADLRDALAGALEAGRVADLRHGSTRVGPHRDDLVLTLGGRELRTYGSAGQQRTAAIGLRILEADTLRAHDAGVAPILLLDDPFAELDERRARAILDVLGGEAVGQVVLAVPRDADIPPGLTRLARARIADGVIASEAA